MNVFPGRNVIVRQGKSGTAYSGTVVKVARGSLDQVFREVGHSEIIPQSVNRGTAKAMAEKFIGTCEKYVAIKWEKSQFGI